MSKSLILKIILGGFLVFLLLPAFYDEEKPAQKNSFKNAYGFDPDGYEVEELPVLEEESSSKDNIFTRYGKRFKQMYGRAFLSTPAEREESPSVYADAENAGGDDDLYYAMAMLFNGSEEAGSLRSSYTGGQGVSVNALPSDGGYAGAYSSMKQTVHDNAPVKGLYESSSVESYETRTKAKQVYSNVMDKVDRSVPSRKAASGGEVYSSGSEGREEQNISSVENGRLESFRYGVPGMVSTPGWAADISDSFLNGAKFKRVYTGIASRSSSRGGYNSSRANSGSTYSGFSSSRTGFTDEDRNAQDLGELFAKASSDITDKVKDISKSVRDNISSRGAGSSGGSSSIPGPDIQMPDGNKSGQGENKGQSGDNSGGNISVGNNGQGSSQGAGDGNSGDIAGGDNQGGGSSNIPAPVIPSAEDKAFDVEDWDTNMNMVCTPHTTQSTEDLPNFPAFKNNFSVSQNKEPKVKDPEDRIETCSDTPVDNVPPLSAEIASKQMLVDLGKVDIDGKNFRATPNQDSVAAAGLKGLGFANYIQGTNQISSAEGAFSGIDGEQFAGFANNRNTIILTTSPAIAEAYLGRTVLINPGDLESKSAVRQIAERLNNMEQETQRILAAKAAREASAR